MPRAKKKSIEINTDGMRDIEAYSHDGVKRTILIDRYGIIFVTISRIEAKVRRE